MDIVGLGTQVLDCPRVRKLIDRHAERFLYQVFTEQEIKFCRDRTHSTEYYAAVWACKEAVFRSLGTKWRRGMSWLDVELAVKTSVAPVAVLSGAARKRADELGVSDILVSFAYTRMYATATALAVK